MYRILSVLAASLLLASCSLFGGEAKDTLVVELLPERVLPDDELSLTVRNDTEESVWYQCGYTVERQGVDGWERHMSVGCVGTEMPVEIKAGRSYTVEVSLYATEVGTYRLIASLSDSGRRDLAEVVRTTNPVTMAGASLRSKEERGV